MPNPLDEFNSNLAFYLSEVTNTPLAKPYWVYISLSHKCNFVCQMCSVNKILKGYELDLQTIKLIFDEISSWGQECVIVLTGGEPFLREDIFEIIQYAAEKNLKVEMVSNGSLIDELLAERIIGSSLKNIAISLDGSKEQTHDYIRQKGAFRNALKAITNLAAAKKRIGFGPQISVWTTIMKENIFELFDIALLTKGLGVECLVYHPVIVFQDDMQNTSSQARFWPEEKDMGVLKAQIDKIIDYKEKNGLVAFLHDPYLWIEHFKGALTKRIWKCNPFVFINIGPDGELRSCGASFGNIQRMSLSECLNSKEASQARSTMKQCLKPCLQTCWAKPEADSLRQIVDNLFLNIEKSNYPEIDKRKLLSDALSNLTTYEEKLKINV